MGTGVEYEGCCHEKDDPCNSTPPVWGRRSWCGRFHHFDGVQLDQLPNVTIAVDEKKKNTSAQCRGNNLRPDFVGMIVVEVFI